MQFMFPRNQPSEGFNRIHCARESWWLLEGWKKFVHTHTGEAELALAAANSKDCATGGRTSSTKQFSITKN
jgi:hypothetical protein